jgi:hypothetical protein
MERHAVDAEVGEVVHDVNGVDRLADLDTERVATDIAYGPETEGEVVLGLGFIRVSCHVLVSFLHRGWTCPVRHR